MEEQQILMLQARQIFDDSKQRYGAEKIRVVLVENSIRVGKERIRKIMDKLGLTSIRENTKKQLLEAPAVSETQLAHPGFKANRLNEISSIINA